MGKTKESARLGRKKRRMEAWPGEKKQGDFAGSKEEWSLVQKKRSREA